MTQYIRFTKTTKKDVTVGKFYEVKTVGSDGGYYFDDDADEQRYVRRRGKLNYFEVFSEADFPINDMSEDEVDDVLTAIERLQEQGQSFDMDEDYQPEAGTVRIEFDDGDVRYFHDVDVFNIEERTGITMVTLGYSSVAMKSFIPLADVRLIQLTGMFDGGDI